MRNKNLLSFNELISEEKKNDTPYRLVVIAERRMVKKAKKNSDKPVVKKPSSTSSKLYNLAKERGCEVYSVKVNGAYIERSDDGVITVHNQDDKKGFELDADTLVMVRGAVTAKDSYLDLISQIERYGFPVVNSRECIEVCADKFRTYLRLQEIGMNQPKTVLVPNEDPETVDLAAERLDNDFPMVLKTLQGAKGVGVLLVETERSLQSTVSLVYKIDPNCDILLQEYIDMEYDVRVMINNKRIIGAMKRKKIIDDFRSNISQGAEAEEIELTDLEKEACLIAAKAVNGQWVGVDFIPADNREKDAPYILEVNQSPGSQGISEAIGEEVCEIVIDDYFDRNIWKKSATECGVLESIEVDGETMTAKLDTGNSAKACALHADEYEIKGKVVHFTRDGKKYKKPLIRELTLLKPAETRPVVMCELNFLNTIYEQEVSLDQRGKIPFLANRDFMNRANLMINPSRKFLLTNKHDTSEED
jgi:ribosomal protein S6--L-glutamate ligase